MDGLREVLHRELTAARRRTLELVAEVADGDLERRADPSLGPALWDLGHLACFEDRWGVRGVLGSDAAVAGPALDRLYDAVAQPRAGRSELPLLDRDAAEDLLARVRERTLDGLAHADLVAGAPLARDGYVWRMLIQHEAQHQETLLQVLARLDQPLAPAAAASPVPRAVDDAERVAIPGGEHAVGGPPDWEPYDNERPRHGVALEPFAVDRFPVTNGRYATFVEAGGYRDPGPWSEAGAAWLARSGARAPDGWTRGDDGAWRVRRFGHSVPLDPREPVQHVSCHEAEAFATWAGGRLPSEAEWEAAATCGAPRGRHPWGDAAADAERANLGQLRLGPAPVGSYPAGASAAGVEQLLGDVYEWTASTFRAYPGFEPFPYPEYSAVFFDRGYRVLRGASWAASPWLARVTYRNWDLPERRQLFAGLRLAWDA